jgi:hypothetical protein
MGDADRTLEQPTLPAASEDYDVASAQPTQKIPVQPAPARQEPVPTSISPVAIDAPRPAQRSRPPLDPTVQIRALPAPRRLQGVVMGVMGASLVILAAATVRAYLMTFEPAPPPVAFSAPPRHTTSPPARPPAPALPTTGTIRLAQGARGIAVDGARITSSFAVVPCGSHLLVARGKTRVIDVPCGGTYLVTP